MLRMILSRTIQAIATLWVIATLIFFLFRLGVPNPELVYLGVGFSDADRAILVRQFGLDAPLWRQYLDFLANSVQGNFGVSFFYRAPVDAIIFEKLLNTLALMLPSLFISLILGPLVGVLLAWRRGSKFENLTIAAGLLMRSAPLFWTGMLGVLVFVIGLGWLPGSGMRSVTDDSAGFLDTIFSLDFLAHLALPGIILGVYYAGVPMLLMRNTMLESLGEDYVEFARARGLSERRVMFAHVARNSLLPIVTYSVLAIALAVGGSVVVEVVFSWPGLGREMVQAVSSRDYPLAQAAFLLLATVVIVMNLLADLLYLRLDPRVTYRRAGA